MNYLALAEDGKEIRLITLRWVETKPQHDPLSELEVHEALSCDLKNCPFHGRDALPGVGDAAVHLPPVNTYVALSYTWNPDDRVKQLSVNGHTVSIGQNLADALQAFQRSDLLRDGYQLWADALCIDQSNITERNREVPRMGAIYQRAKCVMSWLGEAEDDSDLVLDFANALSAAWSCDEQSTRAFLRIALENQGLRLFKAMSAFIERRYWLRVWVIQELAFGSDDGPVFCGRRSTTWGKILLTYRACNLRHGTTSEHPSEIFQQEFSRLPSVVRESYWREMVYWQWNKVEDFRELQLAVRGGKAINTKLIVDRTRHGGCTKNEDKVYGVLGLLSSDIASRIRVDYSMSYLDTFRMFARAWIEGERSLEVLHQCGNDPWTTGHDKPFEENVPSWVPDLTWSKRIMTSSYEPDYNAHGGTKAEVSFSKDGSILSARGVLFDVVEGLSGKRFWEDDYSQFVDSMSKPPAGKNAYSSAEAATEALWRALMGNRDRSGQTAPSTFSNILDTLLLEDPASPCPEVDRELPEDLLWHVHLFFKRHLAFRFCDRPLRDYFHDTNSFSDATDRRAALMKHVAKETEQYFDPIRRMLDFMWYRRLAQTRDGYIAVVPSLAMPGDVIAVLYGSGYPILLRKVEERYKVVAHCYVQGIMDGEVVDMIARGEKEPVDIGIS